MKINKILLFVILSLSYSFTSAQDNVEPKAGFITLNLTSATISYCPRWDLGYYRSLNDRFIVGVEVGYGNYDSSVGFTMDNDILNEDYQLFEIRPEVMYIINPKRRTKKFFSGEIFYISHTDAFTTSRFNENGYEYTFDSADFKRIKYGFNLNYGMVINFTKNFGMIPKVGLGFRHRDVKYSNIVNKSEQYYENEDFIFPSIRNFIENAGKDSGVNFVFDVKLFFRI